MNHIIKKQETSQTTSKKRKVREEPPSTRSPKSPEEKRAPGSDQRLHHCLLGRKTVCREEQRHTATNRILQVSDLV